MVNNYIRKGTFKAMQLVQTPESVTEALAFLGVLDVYGSALNPTVLSKYVETVLGDQGVMVHNMKSSLVAKWGMYIVEVSSKEFIVLSAEKFEEEFEIAPGVQEWEDAFKCEEEMN